MPTCSLCKQQKNVVEFPPNKARKSGVGSRCRSCNTTYNRNYYRQRAANDEEFFLRKRANSKSARLALTKANHTKLRAWLNGRGCKDCGESDPVVLEFDHLRDKVFNISEGMYTRRWEIILEEIEKCEVVCANCHRRRTALSFNWYEYMND